MSARIKDSLRLSGNLERLWADDRFGPRSKTRDFINAWFITRYSIADHDEAFKETLRRVGADRQFGWWSIVREDAPRYRWANRGQRFGCCIPKTRGPNAGKPCGKNGSSFRVTDPATGEWEVRTYCSRLHKHDGEIMWRRERSLTNVPEPLPNSGGLLPCYISAGNWPDVYVWADSSWKPPYVGIRADDWPVMAKVATAPLTKVSLSALDGGCESAPVTAPPSLRLVKP